MVTLSSALPARQVKDPRGRCRCKSPPSPPPPPPPQRPLKAASCCRAMSRTTLPGGFRQGAGECRLPRLHLGVFLWQVAAHLGLLCRTANAKPPLGQAMGKVGLGGGDVGPEVFNQVLRGTNELSVLLSRSLFSLHPIPLARQAAQRAAPDALTSLRARVTKPRTKATQARVPRVLRNWLPPRNSTVPVQRPVLGLGKMFWKFHRT